MLAYTFLAAGALEPLTAFPWPAPTDAEPGPWVESSAVPSEALRGYPASDLPYWLDEELWSTELAGTLVARGHVLLAERARLVRRVDVWTAPVAWEFVTACARRVAGEAAAALRQEGHVGSATQLERAADLIELEAAALAVACQPSAAGTLSGHVSDICFYARDASAAAHAAGIAAKMAAYALAGDAEDARASERLATERAWQSAWLVERLGLATDASTSY